MTRRLLAWSFGASCGYLIGWLAGSNVSRLAEGRRLARPGVAVRPLEPLTAVPSSTEPPEALNGAQEGTWPLDVAALHARPDYQEAMRRAEDMSWDDAVDLVEWLATRGIPTQRDTGHGPPPWPLPTGDACPVTLGPLTCPFTGHHTVHAFQSATWAPDRKADADQEVE